MIYALVHNLLHPQYARPGSANYVTEMASKGNRIGVNSETVRAVRGCMLGLRALTSRYGCSLGFRV